MESQTTDPFRVFVSYRRTDSPGHAGRIQDALRSRLGTGNVFYDVATLQGGVDFTLAIKDAIAQAGVVVVIIGPHWARRSLRHRLFSRTDWVKFEIEHARELGKPILPVIVGGGVMPPKRSLPSGLHFLSTINATSVRDESWESDVERFLERLPVVASTPVTLPAAPPIEPRATATRYLAMAVVAGLAAAVLWSGLGRPLGGKADPGVGPAPSADVANRPPTTGGIDINPTYSEGLVSATKFTFTATGVTDPDGDPIRYTWDFGDGSPPPRSAASVTRVYDRVNRFEVKLLINDGKHQDDVLAATTTVTIRDITGTWLLNIKRDPSARVLLPTSYMVTIVQQGNQLTGRIVPEGSTRATLLIGEVEHPERVFFGSEHAWWNDNEDAYFDLKMGFAAGTQMVNLTPGRCGPQIPCLSALANKQ